MNAHSKPAPSVSVARPGWRLFVSALVLSLAAGAVQLAQAMPLGGHGGHGGSGMHGARLERLLDGVNATREQRTRIGDIMKTAREDLRKQRESQHGQREQMLNLFAQPTVDARAVEAQRQQMLAQHDQASRRMTQALLDAAAVLLPDQRRQLAERMKQRRGMMERHRAQREAMERPSR